MADPALGPEAETDLTEIDTEHLPDVYAALEGLRGPGQNGVHEDAEGYLWMVVGNAASISAGGIDGEIDGVDGPEPRKIKYRPLTGGQIDIYPPGTEYCVYRIPTVGDAGWRLRLY